MAIGSSLVKAYLNSEIPDEGGFIVSAFFDTSSSYTIYECKAYVNLKEVTRSDGGFTFKTDGNGTHMLIEPPGYVYKHVEPVFREEGKSIPYRFDDMRIFSTDKSEKIMIPREPVMLYMSFTVLDKKADYMAYVFHPTKDVYVAIRTFVADSLYNDCNLTKRDSLEVAGLWLETIKKFSIWNAG